MNENENYYVLHKKSNNNILYTTLIVAQNVCHYTVDSSRFKLILP